jgi:hypothetical protein
MEREGPMRLRAFVVVVAVVLSVFGTLAIIGDRTIAEAYAAPEGAQFGDIDLQVFRGSQLRVTPARLASLTQTIRGAEAAKRRAGEVAGALFGTDGAIGGSTSRLGQGQGIDREPGSTSGGSGGSEASGPNESGGASIGDTVAGIGGGVGGAVSGAATGVGNAVSGAATGVGNAAGQAAGEVGGAVSGAGETVGGAVSGAGETVGGAVSGAGETVGGAVGGGGGGLP